MKSRVLAGFMSLALVLSSLEASSVSAFAAYDDSEETGIVSIEEAMPASNSEIASDAVEEETAENVSEAFLEKGVEIVKKDTDKKDADNAEETDEIDEIDENVYTATSGDFTFEVSGGNVTITKYGGEAPEVVIPDTMGGAPVTAIGKNAFKDNDKITAVVFPKDLESIGEDAFFECSKLKTITFNEGLKTTGKKAFAYCAALQEIVLPSSLIELGDQVFAHCENLTKVYIPKSLNNVDLAPFASCPLKTVTFEEGITEIPGTKSGGVYGKNGIFGASLLEEIVIPDTVTKIGDNAFRACSKLKKVTFSKNLKIIDTEAFRLCESLETAILPEGLEEIYGGAFRQCSSLNEVFLPKTITKLEDRAFLDTTALKKVTFEEGTTTIFGPNPIYENDGVFGGSGIENITLPDSVTTIEGCAFAGCKQLQTIKLSKNITSIGAKAFYNCEKLDGVVLPEGITVIQDRIFFNCASLSEINIPSQVTTIQELAFKNCASLNSIYIPKNVEKIEKEAFMGAVKLSSIEFEVHNLYTTEQTLGESAFESCTSLTDVQLGNRITKILKGTFAGCTSLKEIQIPYGVKTVTKDAFSKCHNLEILFVPSSVTSFGTTDDEFERSYNHVPLVYYEKGNVDVKVYASALGWDTEVGIWCVNYQEAANEFPDKNFNNQLYEQRVDKNIDTRLTLREIEATKTLDVSEKEIEDVTGLQLLTSLESLDLSGNAITTFKTNDINTLATLTALKEFACDGNRIEVIDLSNNANLTKLNVDDNKLFALNLSNNKKLSDLTVGNQQPVGTLTSNEYFDYLLDLKSIYGSLYDKSAVKDITDAYLKSGEEAGAENEGIVWNAAYHVPDNFSYGYSVSYGSGATKTMVVDATITNAGLERDDNELIAAYSDGNFRTAIFAALDKNKNDKLSRTEERSYETLDVSGLEIRSVAGIERFWNLKELNAKNNKIASADFSENKKLEKLYLDSNKIKSFDLKKNTALKELHVGGNALAAIDISALTSLESFRGGKQLVSLQGEVSEEVRTIDVTEYDASFDKKNVSGAKALDSAGNETDKEVIVTDIGFTLASDIPSMKYSWSTGKGEMQVTLDISGELKPDDPEEEPEPQPEVKHVTVKFSIDDKLIKTETIEAGDTIADIMPDKEDVEALVPEGYIFTSWFVENTNKSWSITTPVNRNLSLVAKYVKNEDILVDDDTGRDPGLKPSEGEFDEVSATYFFDAYMVKGQTYAFPTSYGYFNAESEKASQKITWKSSNSGKIGISGKYKAKAKKETASEEEIQIFDGKTVDDSEYVYNVRVVSPRLIRTDGGAAVAFKSGTITIGKTVELGIDGLGKDEEYADFYNVSWYSSNAEIARVEDGVVTGYAKGSAKITAYVNGKAFTGTVKVDDKETVAKKLEDHSQITLTPLQSASLKFSNKSFKASNLTWSVVRSGVLVPMKGYNSKGIETDKKISYYQNNFVRVTPAGKVTAIGVGSTALAATDKNGNTQYVTINVSSPVTNTVYLNVKKSKNLKYYNVKASSADAVWSSSDANVTDGNCAKGKVKGGKAGTATVTCKYDPYKTGNAITYKTLVIVEDPKLVADTDGRLKVNGTAKGTLELAAGERYAINANLKNQTAIFTSNKPDVAFVNDAGVIIAKAPGKASITTSVNGMKLTIALVVK